jgi:hypothetical protein
MAKKTRIPELVVGKIYIDGGGQDNVYTLDSDESGALRIGDNKNGSVATIDQRTGKIVAASFKGDGSEMQGITPEGLEQLQTAKLLTLSTDSQFFHFDSDGTAKTSLITLKAKVQNIESPDYQWTATGFTPVPTGDTLTINAAQMAANDSVTVTVTIDDESLSETTTIYRVQDGATGKDAVVVAMSNPTHTYQAPLSELLPTGDRDFMNTGATDIVVRYGANVLKPVAVLENNSFTVTVKNTEFVTVLSENYIVPFLPGGSDTSRMQIAGPADVTAAVGTVTFEVTVNAEGDTYVFEEVQSFSKSIAGQTGATGTDSKSVKLESNDYQFAYNENGTAGDPSFVTITAAAQNHDSAAYYRFFVDDVPWQPGDAAAEETGEHLYTTEATMRLTAPATHAEFGGSKVIKVETQTQSVGNAIASDSISIIATKDGSNAIMIAADNLTHVFPADSAGLVDKLDYADGAITFEVYHGNNRLTFDSATSKKWDGDPNDLKQLSLMSVSSFAVHAEASNFTEAKGKSVDTINPYPTLPTTDASGYKATFTPSSMHANTTKAAIVYSFFIKDHTGQLAGPLTKTQTFTKGVAGTDGTDGRDGPRGSDGNDGADAKACKLTLDDYQIAFDENGGNPSTKAGELNAANQGKINISATAAAHLTNYVLFRFTVDGVVQTVPNSDFSTRPWEEYGWVKATLPNLGAANPLPFANCEVDFSGETYSTFDKKKIVKIETAEFQTDGGGNVLDTSNLTILSEDSESIIATKEGSNAVEVFATNLSHQFVADSTGQITSGMDGGAINFSAYIGNQELTAWTGVDFSGTAPENSFYVFPSPTNIVPGTPSVSGGTFSFGAPVEQGSFDSGNTATISFTIKVKDSTGTARPDRTLVQTLTKVKDGTDSKIIRIDATSNVFTFDDDADWQSEPAEITFSLTAQNLAQSEKITSNDISFFDKDNNDVTARVMDYPFPPIGNTKTKTVEDEITTALEKNNPFSLRFAQFQGLAKDDDGNYISSALYKDLEGNETVAYTLRALKNTGFPLRVKVKKTGLSGPVSSLEDSTRLICLNGATEIINIDVPNNIHIFPSAHDGIVNSSEYSEGGTDITPYIGATQITYDNSAEPANGTYKFGALVYGQKSGDGDGNNMITVDVKGDGSGITITNVSPHYVRQSVTVPVIVTSFSGEVTTNNVLLSYSKSKEGKDGENLKDRNFDFSQGATGWSHEDTAAKGQDLTIQQMKTIEDDKATFGEQVGLFVGSEASMQDPQDSIRSKPIWISERLPVGGTGETETVGDEEVEVDEGVWIIRFRAKSGSSKATVGTSSQVRVWLAIKPFTADNTESPFGITDDCLLQFDVVNESKVWASPSSVFNGKLGAAADTKPVTTSNGLPILDDHYLTYVARITPGDIRKLMPTASTFKIGFWWQDVDIGISGDSRQFHVDAFEAKKLATAGIQLFSPEAAARIANNKLVSQNAFNSAAANAVVNSELSQRYSHLVDESEESNPEGLFNGKLNITSQADNYPEGILIAHKAESGDTATPAKPNRDSSSGFLKEGTGTNIFWAIGASDGQTGIFFKSVKIPSADHDMKISVTYYSSPDSSGGDASKPSMYVYFDNDLEPGKKYITSGTKISGTDKDKFSFSNTSGGIDSGVISKSNSTNIYAGGFELYTGGDESGLTTRTETITFGAGSNVQNMGDSPPKNATIAIFGSGGKINGSTIYIKEVALEFIDTLAAAAEAKARADAAAVGAELVRNNVEDLVKQSTININGDFSIRDDDSIPSGVAPYAAGSGHAEGFSNTKILEMKNDDDGEGDYLRIKYTAINVRNGILLPGVAIPENHFVEVTIRYRTNTLDDTRRGSIYVRYTEKELKKSYKYVGAETGSDWKTSDKYSGTIFEGDDNDIGFESEEIPDSVEWKEETISFPLDWVNKSPKYASIGITGYYFHDDEPDIDIKFINVNFKKNAYRSGTSYPSSMIPQRGDQFFFDSGVEDFGFVTTYGKKNLSFNLGTESNVTAYTGPGLGTTEHSAFVSWPPLLDAQWKRQTGTSQGVLKINYAAGNDTTDAFGNVTGFAPIDRTGNFFLRYYASTSTLIHRRHFFGKAKIRVLGATILALGCDSRNHVGTKAQSKVNTAEANEVYMEIVWRNKGAVAWNVLKTIKKNDWSGFGDTWYDVATSAGNVPSGAWELAIRARANGYDGNTISYNSTDKTLTNCLTIGITGIEIISLAPTVDELLQAQVFEVADANSTTILTFTGQHKCAFIGNEEEYETGKIVSSIGRYDNMNYSDEDPESSGRFSVNPQEAVPVVTICTEAMDKKVLGVVCEKWDGKSKNNLFLTNGDIPDATARYEINSLGEGGIWVSDAAGFLENGDYICSSNIPGYGMKQDDDILRNYTVAKITQDCMFDLESEDYECKEIEHDGQTFKIAFVGCTYHCG